MDQPWNAAIDTMIAGGSSSQFWRGDNTWAIPSGGAGVTSFSAGTTGLTPSAATTGAVVMGGVLGIPYGGTGSGTGDASMLTVLPVGAFNNLSLAIFMGEAQNIMNFGGDNTCTISDNAPALQGAINALPSYGGRIVIPGGCYNFATQVNNNKDTVIDWNGASIVVTNATNNIFNINTTAADGTAYSNFNMTSTPTRTAGYYFHITSLNVKISNALVHKYWRVFDIDGAGETRISDMYGDNPTPNSVSGGSGVVTIGCDGSASGDFLMSDSYFTSTPGNQTNFGAFLCAIDQAMFRNTSFVLSGNGVQISPGTGNRVSLVYFDRSTADTSNNGIVVQTSGGTATDIFVDGSWASVQSGTGILLDSSGGGTISNVTIDGANTIVSDTDGIKTIGTVTNLNVTNGNILSNTRGLNISSATTGHLGADTVVTGNTTNIVNASSGFAVYGAGGGGSGTSCDNMTMKGGTIPSIASGGTASVTFATAFPHAICSCNANMDGGPTSTPIPAALISKSTTGCTFNNASSIGPLAADYVAGGW